MERLCDDPEYLNDGCPVKLNPNRSLDRQRNGHQPQHLLMGEIAFQDDDCAPLRNSEVGDLSNVELLLESHFHSLGQAVVVVLAVQTNSLWWNRPKQVTVSSPSAKACVHGRLFWLNRAA